MLHDKLLSRHAELEEKIVDKQEKLHQFSIDRESVFLPENALRNQLDIEQIGRLQAEKIAIRRWKVDAGDQITADDLNKHSEDLAKRIAQLTERVVTRSSASVRQQGLQRDIRILQELSQEVAFRAERLTLEIMKMQKPKSETEGDTSKDIDQQAG